MDCTLAIASEQLDSEDLQDLTRELETLINRNTEVTAVTPQGDIQPGARGEPITLGLLALTFLSSGAAVAMFQVLKAIFERNAGVEMSFERADGRKLSIKAENVRPEQLDETMALAREFFGGEA